MTQEVFASRQVSDHLFIQKLLVVAVASVLSGYAQSEENCNITGHETPTDGQFDLSNGQLDVEKGWKITTPEQKAKVSGGGKLVITRGGSFAALPIQENNNWSGPGMAVTVTGDAVVTNSGNICVESMEDEKARVKGIHVASDTASATNEGSIQTHGKLGDALVTFNGGTVTNEKSGKVRTSGEESAGFRLYGKGKGINLGEVTAQGKNSNSVEVIGDSSFDNSGSINSASMGIMATDENFPGKAATITNKAGGSITTQGDGINARSAKVILEKGSTITTNASQAIGVNLKSGTLNSSGQIVSAGTAVKLDGNYSDASGANPKLIFGPDSRIESTASKPEEKIAIKGVAGTDSEYPVHIQGGTYMGKLLAEGDTGQLYIENTVTTQAQEPIIITGDIEGFETITVKRSDWKVTGNVKGTRTLDATTSINHILVAGTVDTPEQTTADIRLVTEPGKPVTITGTETAPVKRVQLVDKAVLDELNNVVTLQIAADSWQANKWLTDITTLEADGRINSLHIAGAPLPALTSMYPSQLHLQTDKVPVTITGQTKSSTIGALHIHDNARLANADFQRVKDDDGKIQGTSVQIEGTDWQSTGVVVDPLNIVVNATGKLRVLSDRDDASTAGNTSEKMLVNFTGSEGVFNVTVKGDVETVDFSSNAVRPPLRFVQNGGSTALVKGNGKVNTENPDRNDTLEINSGTVAKSSGFVNYAITGDRQGKANIPIKDPVSIEVGEGGTVNRVGFAALARQVQIKDAVQRGDVEVDFTTIAVSHQIHLQQINADLPDAFVVSNTGGEIKEEVNFSNPVQSGNKGCPALVVNQVGGMTQKVVGGTGKGDHLILSGGSIPGGVEGVENIDVIGSGWEAIIVNDPAKVQVFKPQTPSIQEPHISLLTTRDQLTKEIATDRLQMKFAEVSAQAESNLLKEVDVVSSGVIDNIDFKDAITTRPAIKITLNGGTIGNIAGKYGDSLHVTGSTVSGDIDGLSNIRFSGTETIFAGQHIKTDGTVSVGNDSGNAKLTLNNDDMVWVAPAENRPTKEAVAPTRIHIEEGGTIDTVMPDSDSNTRLNVKGFYQQDGTLRTVVVKQPELDKESPLAVDATEIKLGDKAVVDIPNLTDALSGSSVLLMKSESAIDGAAPMVHQPVDLRYTLFGSMLNEARTEVRLNSTPMGSHISGLAAQGQADKGSQRAIETAINPKGDSVTLEAANDPLNDWTRAQCRAVKDEPVAVAKIARQMAPDHSGASVGAAKAGIQQSGKAIAARQSAQRTGISTGDMYSGGNVWIQYAYNNATQKEKDGIYGYEATTHGFTLGADTELRADYTFGAAYTYSKGDIKGKDGSQSNFDTTGHIFSLYGTMPLANAVFLDTQFSYGRGENDGKRQVDNAGEIKAKYNTSSWYLGVLAGSVMPLSAQWSWVPQLAFNYANIETDDYKEEGGNTEANNLTFDKVSTGKYEIMEMGVGVKMVGDMARDSMTIKPEASLMVYHDFKDDPVTMTAHYAAGGNSFVVHGAKRDTTRMQLGLGAELEMNNNISMSLSYDYHWMDTFSNHGFKVKGSYRF